MENPFETIYDKLSKIESMLLDIQNKQIQFYQKDVAGLKMLCMKEASLFLGIGVSFLYKLTSERKLPYYKVGKRNYFKIEELIEWQASNPIKTIDERVYDAIGHMKKEKKLR